MFLHLWPKHNIQAGSGFWKAFLFAACSATSGWNLSKGAWSHSREKTQVAGFQEDAFFLTFFPVARKLSMNLLLCMLFSADLVKEFSHVYCIVHSSLSAVLTRIHFSGSILFSCYVLNSQCIDFPLLCFKTCIHWQVHWAFSIIHCSVWHMYRQRHCSGIYTAFWLKLGKYIFCSNLCCQLLMWHWSSLPSKLWLSFAICNI